MNIQKGYKRTLSADEVRDKVVMVTSEALRFFPKPFRKFTMITGDSQHEVAVEAKECTCRGPANPHEHYWLPMKDLLEGIRWERGTHVTVKKEKDLVYRLLAE
jgi:hypothetical protein